MLAMPRGMSGGMPIDAVGAMRRRRAVRG